MEGTEERLFTPGPTPLPPSVRKVLERPAPYHRTGEFRTVLARVTAGLMRLFQTQQPVLTITGSGTAAMEAVLVNLARPGETVAVLNGGKYGERWHALARAYGLKVVELTCVWGGAFSAGDVAAFLDGEAKRAELLLATHCETSTGTVHDLEGITAAARERGKLVVADLVTSLGVHRVDFDRWGLAAAVTASQGGLMGPPGLAFAVLSEAGWARVKQAALPRFYLDLNRARAALNANSTPFAPAVPLVLALEESLRLIEKEGLDAVLDRHARHAEACRAAVQAWGLSLFSDRPANGLTAVRSPEGKDGEEVVKRLREEHRMRIAGGQEPMKGKLFRLGHMGWRSDEDILDLLTAVEAALHHLKWTGAVGTREAAQAVLDRRSPDEASGTPAVDPGSAP